MEASHSARFPVREVDVRDFDALRGIFAQEHAEVVVHAAARVPFSGDHVEMRPTLTCPCFCSCRNESPHHTERSGVFVRASE